MSAEADAAADHPQRWVAHAFFGANVLYSRIFYAQMGQMLAPYLFVWFVAAVLLCWHSDWTRHHAWVHVYATLFAQTLCDALHILVPQGFVLYAAIPLTLLGTLEVLVIAALRTHAYREHAAAVGDGARRARPSRLVRCFVGLYMDTDIRRWYALLFDVYMTLCSLALALRGSFMRVPCLGAAYSVVVGLLFLAAEDLRDTRAATGVPLPAPAVKAVYALYAPARYLQPLLFLAALVLAVGGLPDHTLVSREIGAAVVAAAVFATIHYRDLEACPV